MRLRRFAAYDVLVLVSLIWFLGKFVRYAFPPLFEQLQATYGVSNTLIGAAFTGFMIVYALMQFPSGVVADRIGAVRVIVGGATVAGLGALALVVDSPFPVLVAAMLVIGAGTGVHKTVAVRLIARVYPSRTGRALGAHDTFGAFGGVAAPAAVVTFLSAPPALAWLLGRLPGADWRAVFLLTGIAALALAAAFGLRFRDGSTGSGAGIDHHETGVDREPTETDHEPTETDHESTDTDHDRLEPSGREYLSLFRDPRLAGFVCVTLGVSFAHNGLVAFLPLYLARVAGLTTVSAGLLYSLFFWVTFVQLLAGDLSDRVGRFPVIVATIGLAAVALWGIVLAPGLGIVGLGVLIAAVGVGAHGFQPVRSAYLMETLPDRLAGGGLGAVRTLLMSVGALAPGIVGIAADAADFRFAFGLLAASMAIATVGAAVLWVAERR